MSSAFLIYGATGGVGSCLARMLTSEGHRLHLVARNAAALEALADELRAGWTAADVLDDDSFARVAERAPWTLDGLVYAVGSINLRSLARITTADLERDYRLNASTSTAPPVSRPVRVRPLSATDLTASKVA